jgi:predicted AlkP superfamily phosphohydrolase/phosphomutase/tetratricopeptide (TPR) repeat protein
MRKRRVLLIGWDAADWKIINPLMDTGKMPNVQRLVEGGAMAQIATLHPALSPMLWTSIATGKRPFQHGIHGFSEPTPDGRAVQPVTNLSRKCKAVWNIFNQNDIRSIVIGWWPSHPAEPIDGVTVSDMFHKSTRDGKEGPLMAGAVHPARLFETLADLRLQALDLPTPAIEAFVPKAREVDQSKDRRLSSLAKTLSECVNIHSAATWLLDNEPWDFFAVYYDAIDHFCHGFMKYHPPRQEWVKERDFELYQNVVSMGYQFHDQMLGTLLKKAGDDVTVILMSDHGFHPDHLRPRYIPEIPAGPAIEHRDFGILVINGDGIRKDELIHGPSVLDITPTLLTLYGLPVGADMDGKVLTGAFEEPPEVRTIPSWEEVPGRDGRHPPHTRLDPSAAKETLEQLVALGYIAKLDEDMEVAVARTVGELKYNLCEAYQDADRHAEALEIARELYASDPNEQRFAVRVFTCCQALGYADEMRRVVEDLDTRRRALYQGAIARLKELRAVAKERFEERKPALEAARAKGEMPTRASLLTEQERLEWAACSKLRKFQPAVVDFLKAQVLSADRKFGEALECLERVQDAHLARPGLFLQTADLYRKLRRFEDARQTYEKALAVDPDNPHAHLGLCRMALQRGDFQQAIERALDCVQRQYHYPLAHLLLGIGLARVREFRRAAEALRVAIAQNPNFAQAHRRLALILKLRLNDPASAAENVSAYRELRKSARQRARYMPAETAVAAAAEAGIASREFDIQALPALGEDVLVVSGMPRSGTSMLMQMLHAGGMPALTDGLRTADEDNPRGYFEYEPVKAIHKDASWMGEAHGKVVKIVAPLLGALPTDHNYRVVFMDRDPDELLASQRQMILRRGGTPDDDPAKQLRLRAEFVRIAGSTKAALAARDNVRLLTLDRAAVLRDPLGAARALNAFAGGSLAVDAMAAEVKPELHRQTRNAAAPLGTPAPA